LGSYNLDDRKGYTCKQLIKKMGIIHLVKENKEHKNCNQPFILPHR
jgi:hypothetical protein